jgi:exopolysaccharide biosynthesis protein
MGTTRIDREIQEERETLKRARRNRKKNKRFKKKNKKKNKLRIFFTIMFNLGTVGIITVLTLLYGPWSGFREWLVTTAMTTMTHQYFATWFYDDNVIQDILNRNKVVESGDSTDADLINITYGKNEDYANDYEREILERDPNNNDYKIIPIDGKGYSGYLAVVYDPSRVKTVATAKLRKLWTILN